MNRTHLAALWVVALACGTASDDLPATDADTDADTDSDTDTDPDAARCDEPTTSVTGEEGALVRGVVRLPANYDGPKSGTLFVGLAHEVYSGEVGGGYHTHITKNVDLSSGPATFELDMGMGSAMWSEDNCSYSIIAFLDHDNDGSSVNLLPDPGEPAKRVGDLMLSCDLESPCLDMVLDCVDGVDCGIFPTKATCSCDDPTCSSDFAICAG